MEVIDANKIARSPSHYTSKKVSQSSILKLSGFSLCFDKPFRLWRSETHKSQKFWWLVPHSELYLLDTMGTHQKVGWHKFEYRLCCALFHEKFPQHNGHKGDPGVTPETRGAIAERAQVILVSVRARVFGMPPTHKDKYSWGCEPNMVPTCVLTLLYSLKLRLIVFIKQIETIKTWTTSQIAM